MATSARLGMSAGLRPGDGAVSDRMTIGEVSALVNVATPTLRSWEQRYQIPRRTRQGGSTRRYDIVDLQMLTLMRDETARGVRAADAAQSVRELFDTDRAGAPFVSELLDACGRLDAASIGRCLDRAAASLGDGPCLDEVVFPVMRLIGLNWQTGQMEVEHEHTTTQAVHRWLRHRAAGADLPADSPLVLLVPLDRHNIGLHALAVLLHQRRFRCGGLPVDSPAKGIAGAVRARRPAAVVVLSHLPSTHRHAVRQLNSSRGGAHLFYAGNAFSAARSRRGAPGHYLGRSVQDAAELIDTTVRGAPSLGWTRPTAPVDRADSPG